MRVFKTDFGYNPHNEKGIMIIFPVCESLVEMDFVILRTISILRYN